MEQEYIDLREKINAAGLLEKNVEYYILRLIQFTVLYALSIALIFYLPAFWPQALNMVFMSFVLVQLGLLGHDIAHHQVFYSPKARGAIGCILWNLFIGVDMDYWNTKHNRHHANPNQIGKDGDINLPIIFSKEQAENWNPLAKKILIYQHLYFYIMIFFSYFNSILHSARFLIGGRKIAMGLLAILRFSAYLWLIFWTFDILHGSLLLLTMLMGTGVYMSLVFAPNHKGMLILGASDTFSYRHQILTSRNVKPNFFTDFWYGGLNYQIEHHLFPTMPRNHLRKARVIVKEFCRQKGIPYHETGMLDSFREIHSALYATFH